MCAASIVSPFSVRNSAEDWITWEQSQRINVLLDRANTDYQSVRTDEKSISTSIQSEDIAYIPQIHRPQYNAVLERFSRANRMKGNFTSWST